jgi:hypothetical protein
VFNAGSGRAVGIHRSMVVVANGGKRALADAQSI